MNIRTHTARPGSLQLAQAGDQPKSGLNIKPLAILDVVRRRGRSWGLLAQYEEARLGLLR
ncbi:MAG: hypothetical protein H6R19_1888 [Proteobacteria bacterium]|nr:hypothetical protein [Pseudomonadota bacterium]